MPGYNQQDLINSVVRYRTERAALKAAYRKMLDTDMQKYLVAVGEQITLARAAGATVDEIAADFGTKNRTFVYEALNAYMASVTPGYVPEPTPESAPEPEVEQPEYTIQHAIGRPENFYHVTIDHEAWIIETDEDGQITSLPDEWLKGTHEERALYKRIIAQIESA